MDSDKKTLELLAEREKELLGQIKLLQNEIDMLNERNGHSDASYRYWNNIEDKIRMNKLLPLIKKYRRELDKITSEMGVLLNID